MASGLFASLFRKPTRAPEFPPTFPFTIETNPYKCKRSWPPDFTQLSQKHQFRLERRYRRRSKLKYARPNWVKGVKLAQWGSILFVCVYGVLFMEVDQGKTPFDGIRKWYHEQMGTVPAVKETPDENSPVSPGSRPRHIPGT